MEQAPDLQALLAEIKAKTASVREDTAREREKLEARRRERADEEKAMADQRRAGEAGRDWQVLQQRIDMNQTTLDDVLTGVDQSAEAQAVRRTVESTVVPQLREQFAAAGESEEVAGTLDNLEHAQVALADMVKRMSGNGTKI